MTKTPNKPVINNDDFQDKRLQQREDQYRRRVAFRKKTINDTIKIIPKILFKLIGL